MSEKFKKVSETEYQILFGNKWETVNVPWGKTEAILKEFAGQGGIIDPISGEIKTDLLTMVSQFSKLGTILLSEYDEEGKLVNEISCKGRSTLDVINTFMLVQEIITNFMLAISEAQKEIANQASEKEKTKTKK